MAEQVTQYTASIKRALAVKDEQIHKLIAAGQTEHYLKLKWSEQCEELKSALQRSENERRRLEPFETQCTALKSTIESLKSQYESEQSSYILQVCMFKVSQFPCPSLVRDNKE